MGGESNHRLNEKVAGGSTREDGQAPQPGSTTPATPKDEEYFGVTVGREFPATDPAPAVCVWTQEGWEYRTAGCNGWSTHVYSPKYSTPGNKCPYCKAPIKFTEAKT